MKPLADFLLAEPPQKKRAGSERSDLIRYFHDRAMDRKGKPFRAGYIAYRLAHLSIRDLYAFRSDLEDRMKTFRPYTTKEGEYVPSFNWNKAFWGALKADQ